MKETSPEAPNMSASFVEREPPGLFPWPLDHAEDIDDTDTVAMRDGVDEKIIKAFVEHGKDTQVFMRNIIGTEELDQSGGNLEKYLGELPGDQVIDMNERSRQYEERISAWEEAQAAEIPEAEKNRIRELYEILVERLGFSGVKERRGLKKERVIKNVLTDVAAGTQKVMSEKGISAEPHYKDALSGLFYMERSDWPRHIRNIPAARLWAFGRYVRAHGAEAAASMPELRDVPEQLAELQQIIEGENARRLKDAMEEFPI